MRFIIFKIKFIFLVCVLNIIAYKMNLIPFLLQKLLIKLVKQTKKYISFEFEINLLLKYTTASIFGLNARILLHFRR